MLLGGSRHLVELELSAGFLAISRVLRDDALLHGLVETGDKFLELLLSRVLVGRVSGLEELLVRIVELGLGDGVALVRLSILTIALASSAATLDISHFRCILFWECSRNSLSKTARIRQEGKFSVFWTPDIPPNHGSAADRRDTFHTPLPARRYNTSTCGPE